MLMDGGLGVVRVDSDQYDQCESLVFNTRTLRNNRQCLLALTAYPHVLRELAVLEAGSTRPVLPSTLRIDVTPRPQGPTSVSTPSAVSYLPLLQRMLHDPITGRAMEALLALSLLGIGRFDLDPPAVKPALERLEITSVPSYSVKQLAYNLKGFLLTDTGSGFSSRLVYDAAGLALGRFRSVSTLLKACDVTFLVQRVRTSGRPSESSILIRPSVEERQLLMQRMYELIVDGQLQELCQHPSLGCLVFLRDFQAFCARHKNYVQRVVSAVDTEHGLPLLYWSVWSLSRHLTRWCLAVVTKHAMGAKALSRSLLSSALAIILLTRSDVEARSEEKGFLQKLIRLKLKTAAEETMKLTLPLPKKFATEETRGKFAELKTRLQSQGVCYLDDPSLPIPDTLLSVIVTEDAVSVELPSQHWCLVLKLLADREVDETDDNGNTLLHLAAHIGHVEAIAIAVKGAASATVTNHKELTPYQLAQRRRKGKKHVSGSHDDSLSQDLHNACRDGDVDTVKVVLCQGASLHDKGDNGDTPLHSACRAGQAGVAFLLIQLGSDMHAKNKASYTPLHLACESGHMDTVRLLVEHGAAVNTKGDDGVTPIHGACVSGHVDTVRLLVEHGADVNVKGRCGDTPLHCACHSGHVDTVRLLVQHGSDVNAKGEDCDTPLHLACESGLVDVVRLLLEHGADVDVKKDNGATPLHLACESGLVDAVRLLVEHGADVKDKRDDGDTPLHRACVSGDVDTVRLLVELNADVDVTGKYGDTPLNRSCLSCDVDIIRLLVEHGVDLDMKGDDRNTPLHRACLVTWTLSDCWWSTVLTST